MQIDISEPLKSPEGSEFRYSIEIGPQKIDEGIELVKPLISEMTLTKIETGFIGHFALDGSLNLLCFRCARIFSENVKINFNQEYIFTDKRKTNIIDEEQDRDLEKITSDKIDPWPLIRQEILLSLPMRVLCKDTCKGICPDCGRNLNEKKCSDHRHGG